MTEKGLYELYGNRFFESLSTSTKGCELNFLPTGESSKYFSVLDDLCEKLIDQGVSKKSILIAFGGGAVGNIVGLAAGLIYRGIRYVEVPTTFTGQTDSTLSNKQAVNGKSGKNHFGLYHAPLFVWSDTKYLETEPASSTRSGIIEGIKNRFIANPPFLMSLYERLRPELDFTQIEVFTLAYNIIKSKLDILRKDPSEKKLGLTLEYGHTFGHAIEWLQKGKMSHGESVSFGMKIAADLGYHLGFLSKEDVFLHYDIIENRLGFNNPFPEEITIDKLIHAMISDNKKTGEVLQLLPLKKIKNKRIKDEINQKKRNGYKNELIKNDDKI